MVVSSPQQEIYLLCLRDAARLFEPGYPNGDPKVVYDYLPMKEVKYPFVFIGEAFDLSQNIKTNRMGQVEQTIHVYHNEPTERVKISKMLEEARLAVCNAERTKHFKINVVKDETIFGWDRSTDTPLIHGVLRLIINYTD